MSLPFLSMINHLSQTKRLGSPKYDFIITGSASNQRLFKAILYFSTQVDLRFPSDQKFSKKEAKLDAARRAYEFLTADAKHLSSYPVEKQFTSLGKRSPSALDTAQPGESSTTTGRASTGLPLPDTSELGRQTLSTVQQLQVQVEQLVLEHNQREKFYKDQLRFLQSQHNLTVTKLENKTPSAKSFSQVLLRVICENESLSNGLVQFLKESNLPSHLAQAFLTAEGEAQSRVEGQNLAKAAEKRLGSHTAENMRPHRRYSRGNNSYKASRASKNTEQTKLALSEQTSTPSENNSFHTRKTWKVRYGQSGRPASGNKPKKVLRQSKTATPVLSSPARKAEAQISTVNMDRKDGKTSFNTDSSNRRNQAYKEEQLSLLQAQLLRKLPTAAFDSEEESLGEHEIW